MQVKVYAAIPPDVEAVGRRLLGCALTVHRILGPGYPEKVYHRALGLELDDCGISFESEKRVYVPYKQWELDGHRLDLVVAGCVIAELKVTPRLRELHRTQLLSYLKATGLRLGYVINFNCELLKQGIRRVVL